MLTGGGLRLRVLSSCLEAYTSSYYRLFILEEEYFGWILGVWTQRGCGGIDWKLPCLGETVPRVC